MNYKNLSTPLLSLGALLLLLGSTSIIAFHMLTPVDNGVEEKSIIIKSAELYDASIGRSPHMYKVNIAFDFISNENIEFGGCLSPFWVKLVNSKDYQLVLGEALLMCKALLPHSLKSGKTEYSLTADLIPIEYDSYPALPQNLEIVVLLEEN